ncbi:hypothetical protein Mal64_14260 [Pseudobythopirellula maris]|uniref:Uncharacterized protein n=1 Tax=Pseudobythopirellula maris TaxID=2527991 RepID=A0A5C5ZVI9_9BACT|nr:glycoside hydrolase family 95 protein [Pseudobythopirellula maris]TWT91027.1 hypothetical protein Mal64_14260 [Pseudobythopirellula maris]
MGGIHISRLAATIIAAAGLLAFESAEGRSMVFDAPAERFTESCPLGNGRLGAMVFGGVERERVVLNESGMWSGSPQEADRPNAHEALPEIRRLLLEGKNAEAEELVNRNFTCAGEGSGRGTGKEVPYGCYQTLGDLEIELRHAGPAETRGYRRELDFETAIASVAYTRGGVAYEREAFVSAPGEAIVYRLTADQPGAIALTASLSRAENAKVRVVGPNTIEMNGQLSDGKQGNDGVRFAARLRVIAEGGVVTADEAGVTVSGADSATLVLTAATDIKTFAGRPVDNAVAAAADDQARVERHAYDDIKQRHVERHQELFGRVSLDVGAAAPNGMTTPERIAAFQQNRDDPDLVATLFDYGRYLLIGSSRPNGLPANLQGVWAEELQTPWNADWHLNVNLQMNYWPAETTNLSELHEPVFALIDSLSGPGAKTAKAYYNARGWVGHLLANPWGFTSPGESASWGATPTCSAWLCQHLWDHYQFTLDRQYLERVYPLLRGAAEFYLDLLIEEPSHGWLVTAPSNSPESAFLDENGEAVHICMGPTMDQQLLRYLFDACQEASLILGVDEALREELVAARERLAPTQIGSDGRVLEWLTERPEQDPHHRHASHLWALYPGSEITPRATPALAEASRKSLEVRGDDGTGWGLANKACLWARLGDGDRAYRLVSNQLRLVGRGKAQGQWRGGVYPNLLDAHPPFQIDGNFGATAAVAEMLVQSRLTDIAGEPQAEVVLLPALPGAWPEGSVTGLCARGDFDVDLAWSNDRVTSVTITSHDGVPLSLSTGDASRRLELAAGETLRLGPDLEAE